MDQTTQLLILILAAVAGLVAVLAILRRRRGQEEEEIGPVESPFAVSTEGMKRCPACGLGNLVTDATCSSCGEALPG